MGGFIDERFDWSLGVLTPDFRRASSWCNEWPLWLMRSATSVLRKRGEFAEKERRDQRFLGRCDWD